MDLKPFLLVMKFIDSLYYSPVYGREGDTLEILFNSYLFNNKFLNAEDYLYEKTGIEKYIAYKNFEEQYKNLSDEKRLALVVALFNLVYFSYESEETKTKFSSFLYRYKIKLDQNEEYKNIVNFAEDEVLEGSYGKVYLIADNLVQKQLKYEYWEDKDIISRFKNEFLIQERLKELGAIVLSVFDYNSTDFSFIMERADYDLFDYLENNIVEEIEKVSIIEKVLETMKIAHNNGIIHRDLHYGNILIRDSNVYINDFGFAKDSNFLRSRLSTSTPKPNHTFVAPEGFKNFNDIDIKSDIFSIGKIIDYIMGNGNFGENHIFKLLIEKCTRNDKKERYQNINELISAFKKTYDIYKTSDNLDLILKDIKNCKYNEATEIYILKLTTMDEISNFMVSQKNPLKGLFQKISSESNKEKIIQKINETFVDATGYGGWENYEIFGEFAFEVLLNESNIIIRKQALEILEECASKRWKSKHLLDSVPKEIKLLLE